MKFKFVAHVEFEADSGDDAMRMIIDQLIELKRCALTRTDPRKTFDANGDINLFLQVDEYLQ